MPPRARLLAGTERLAPEVVVLLTPAVADVPSTVLPRVKVTFPGAAMPPEAG